MSIFSKIGSFLKHGNLGISVNENARRYEQLGSLSKVCDVYYGEWHNRRSDKRRADRAHAAARMISEGKVGTFKDLSVLSLWVDAAPDNFSLADAHQEFGDKLAVLYRNKGLT